MKERKKSVSKATIVGGIGVLALMLLAWNLETERKPEVKTVSGLVTVNVDKETGFLLGSTFEIKPEEKYLFKTIETGKHLWVTIRNEEPVSNQTVTFKKGDTCVIRSAFISKLKKVTEKGMEVEYESPETEAGGWCPSGSVLFMKEAR